MSDEADVYAPASTSHYACVAAGCPLPGTISGSANGSASWYCGLHWNASPAAWPAITARANNRRDLLEAAWRLTNAAPRSQVPKAIRQVFEGRQRGDLLLIDGKPVPARTAGAHALASLEREIRTPGQQQGIESAREAAQRVNGPRSMGEMIAAMDGEVVA